MLVSPLFSSLSSCSNTCWLSSLPSSPFARYPLPFQTQPSRDTTMQQRVMYPDRWLKLGFVSSFFTNTHGYNSLSRDNKNLYHKVDLCKKASLDRHFPLCASGTGKLFPPVSIRGYSTNIAVVFKKVWEWRRFLNSQQEYLAKECSSLKPAEKTLFRNNLKQLMVPFDYVGPLIEPPVLSASQLMYILLWEHLVCIWKTGDNLLIPNPKLGLLQVRHIWPTGRGRCCLVKNRLERCFDLNILPVLSDSRCTYWIKLNILSNCDIVTKHWFSC